jgi:hypothetical protein
MQCALNAKSMPGCAPNQRHNRLFCKGKFVVKFRDGYFGRSITEVDHKAGNFHQIRCPGSAGCPAANAHTSHTSREARHLLRAARADAAELAAGTYSPRTLAARAARAARAYVVEAEARERR